MPQIYLQNFRDRTLAAITMPLTVGSRLGHYHVTALIGEVYRARDTKLDRVAVVDPLDACDVHLIYPSDLSRSMVSVDRPRSVGIFVLR